MVRHNWVVLQELDRAYLQEVSPGFHKALEESGLFAWLRSSLAHRPPLAEEGRVAWVVLFLAAGNCG